MARKKRRNNLLKSKNYSVLSKQRVVNTVTTPSRSRSRQVDQGGGVALPQTRPRRTAIRPFIITCNKRMDSFRKFVDSYLTVKSSIKRPIVYYDGEDEEYHNLIDSLDPIEKIKQCSKGLQEKAIWEFPKIVKEKYPNEYVLFLEDDVIFSSKFKTAIWKAENGIRNSTAKGNIVDLLTLYGSGDCYWPTNSIEFFYKFNGHDYYGNLAVIFSPRLMSWWYENRDKVWHNQYAGWDIKIGFIFQDNGFNFYCTTKHFVQHQVGHSAISGEHKEQQSGLFVK